MTEPQNLFHTPLHGLHLELDARMVPFAGWEMPIQYEGVVAEHSWCRSHAALFDVSHMAIVDVAVAPGAGTEDQYQMAATALETVTPAGVTSLAVNRQRYGVLTNESGGIIDDLIITNRDNHLTLVVNAARADIDLAYLGVQLPAAQEGITLNHRRDLALLALQGPEAAQVMARLWPETADMVFLEYRQFDEFGVSRSGYSGEDGFEIMVPVTEAEKLARQLLDHQEVRLAGLGARDSLRLEAGLHLYGQDLDETTSPVEAGLTWTIPRRRRDEGGFPGYGRIATELESGPSRRRVGLAPVGRRPVRPPAGLASPEGVKIGTVTSGGYGPTVEAPIAMGYVETSWADSGQRLVADVRGKAVEVEVVDLPFVSHNYYRGAK